MGKKRKHDSKSSQPPQRQAPKQIEPIKKVKQIEHVEPVEEEEEYEEIEEEEDVEEEENHNHKSAVLEDDDDDEEDDDDDYEPLEKLLEPLGKEQLINLLQQAADKHHDVADLIRRTADQDPVHRKIFVHGLGWDTNSETLMNAFKSYGEIEDCKAVYDKVSGKSKGYGFILFKRRSGARKALEQPQKKIGNRMTACQLASVGPVPTPAGGGGATTSAAANAHSVPEYPQKKIYVSNVGAELDPQKLTAFFSKYGEIEEGPLGLDKVTGKPKGFCLFVYKTAESARKALEEPHKNFEGHILHCQKAIDGPKHGKNQQQHNVYNSHFQRNDNNPVAYVGGAAAGPAHLMPPPAAAPGIGLNPTQALNPALEQALTALIATQGAGLGLTNLLGSLGSAAAMTQGGGPAMQGAYGNQANISPGVIGAYGNQGAIAGAYPNQQIGQGGSGRGQHTVGQYGGAASYMGH